MPMANAHGQALVQRISRMPLSWATAEQRALGPRLPGSPGILSCRQLALRTPLPFPRALHYHCCSKQSKDLSKSRGVFGHACAPYRAQGTPVTAYCSLYCTLAGLQWTRPVCTHRGRGHKATPMHACVLVCERMCTCACARVSQAK